MNLNNVKKAIAIMERVKERDDLLDLCVWQHPKAIQETEEELHECGTSACLAGWIAVSPEFQADGGSVGADGGPILGTYEDHYAVARWLGIPNESDSLELCGMFNARAVYGVDEEEVTVDDVLRVLYRLRDTGSVYLKENE